MLKKLAFTLLLLLSLAACSPLEKPDQPVLTDFSLIDDQNTPGQTFLARYDGLEGIALYLKPDFPGDGTLTLHLRASPEDTENLTEASLPLLEVKTPGFYRFQFTPIQHSNRRSYFLIVKLQGQGSVKVGTSASNTYLNGVIYWNKSPQDAQLTFHLVYNRNRAIVGLSIEILGWLGRLLLAFFLFVIPGWGMFSLLYPGWNNLHWAEKIALTSGLSLAIYPLLFLWTDLVGQHLGALYAWLPPIIGLLLICWRNRQSIYSLPEILRFKRPLIPQRSILSQLISPVIWNDQALLVILILTFFTRFWVIRSLDIPLGNDSYHHTMISQLFLDHGGLVKSWEPYAGLETFTYHFGFHTAPAIFNWILPEPTAQSVLWVGQIFNGLAVLALYPLAKKIGNGRWAGLLAVLLGGLLLSMPMFYINWGRYTQLAGQVILPVAVFLVWRTLESEQLHWRLVILSWLALGGLALTHYRILIFALLFIPVLWIGELRHHSFRTLIIRTFWLGLGSFVLFLPWFIHAFTGKILGVFGLLISSPPSAMPETTRQLENINNLSIYLPVWMWLLIPLALAWGLWRRNRGVAILAMWWFFLLLAANPSWVGLPGTGIISSGAVYLAAYIPASILLGASINWGIEAILANLRGHAISRAVCLGILLALLGMGVWGARQRLFDLRLNELMLVTRPDVNAAAWIRDNTPENAQFLVNGFFAFGSGWVMGSDGGWWLPLLAGRSTSLPPMVYLIEKGPVLNYIGYVNSLYQSIQAKGLSDPDILSLLKERGITHVYIGQRKGSPSLNDPSNLSLNLLLSDPHYRLIYHRDLVWVFEILYSTT